MSIYDLTLKKGEVAFLWFNSYAGVVIRTPFKTLIIDPADVDPTIFKEADVLLITHEHYDHFDESITREIHRRTMCPVVADPTSAKRLGDMLPAGKLHEMRIGDQVKIGNITIRAESFRHPATTPVSYLITTEDGIRVYHTGDSLPVPGMKQIGERTPPDVLFCTVGNPAPGASPSTGLEIVKMVKPKVVVPYHAMAADRREFAELVAKESPNVKCVVVEQGKPFKYP